MEENTFYNIIKDVVNSNEFREMKNYQYHKNGNLFRHCIKVAYLCYLHHKKKQMKIDIEEFVIGALLHDYFLYNLHAGDKKYRFHWFKHSKIALKNAMQKYPNLTKTQQDMIKRHMFPVTLIPPRTKAGWLVCYYDKVAAISDCFENNKKKKKQKKLDKI